MSAFYPAGGSRRRWSRQVTEAARLRAEGLPYTDVGRALGLSAHVAQTRILTWLLGHLVDDHGQTRGGTMYDLPYFGRASRAEAFHDNLHRPGCRPGHRH